MQNIYNTSIILSFAGLWLTSYISGSLEIIFGFVLIFSFGILHGSNDIVLINSIAKSEGKNTFGRVLFSYLLTVFSAVVVFYFFPLVALFFFVLFSAFHFGEQHWEYRELKLSKGVKSGFYLIYGMLILNILFVLNPSDVIEIVASISNTTINQKLIVYSFLFSAAIFVFLSVFLYFKSKPFRSIILKEIGYLLIFAIIFKVSTLIWGFTIYFIFWHSIPSLFEQVSFIYGNFDRQTVLKYIRTAFPYWLASIIGMTIVFFIFKDDTIFDAIFFSFIAAVTFPHALVINRMFDNKKTQPN
jgi:Brp/Blh family beta-carotene 15,15'-monooxygenase